MLRTESELAFNLIWPPLLVVCIIIIAKSVLRDDAAAATVDKTKRALVSCCKSEIIFAELMPLCMCGAAE